MNTPSDAAILMAQAQSAGIPIDDAAMATRIAAGAAAAIAAVRSVAGECGFDHEPGDFLAALEKWAVADSAGDSTERSA